MTKKLLSLTIWAGCALAGEFGHHNPGVTMVRDFIPPEKSGFYYLLYNVFYTASSFKDGDGNNVPPSSGNVNFQTDVGAYVSAHHFLWQTGKRFLGGQFAVMVQPGFGRSSVNAVINAQGRPQQSFTKQWGLVDLQVRPLFLVWHEKKFDASVSYEFFAPVGRYRTGSAANNGLGMWSHRFQGATLFYPGATKRTALLLAGIYEVNTSQRGLDDIPGAHFSLEYGASHFLKPRFEIGVGGFQFFQVGSDRGRDAVNPSTRNRINGIGPQIGVTLVPDHLSMAARVIWDYGVRGSFQGLTGNISLFYAF